MKRFWIGICALALLLALGIATSWGIKAFHAPISLSLERASQAALDSDWTAAAAFSDEAFNQWQRCRDLAAAFADHSVLEEMDCLFAQIRVLQQSGDRLAFASACAYLSRLSDAVAESHLPKWQNLL